MTSYFPQVIREVCGLAGILDGTAASNTPVYENVGLRSQSSKDSSFRHSKAAARNSGRIDLTS